MPTILTENPELVSRIAGVLVGDPMAINMRNSFHYQLGLTREHLPNTNVPRDFFHEILQAYVAKNSRPSLESIIKVLRELDLINCAALLRSEVPQVATILELYDGRISVHPQPMIKILEEIGDIPFISICINGPMRCGKSFLISSIAANLKIELTAGSDWIEELRANVDDFFEWRSGIEQPVTKGVNLWKTPSILARASGSPFGILLMDAQGEFDLGQHEGQSGLLFAFTSIIASTNIYNLSYAALNRSSTEPFRLFLNNMVSIAAQTCQGEVTLHQRFVLLVRDVPEGIYRSGLYTSETQINTANSNLFTAVFRTNGVMGQCASDINRIFSDVSLFALPDPGTDLKSDSLNNITDSFKSKVRDFYKFIVNKRHPVLKIANGNDTTGINYIPIFQEFARSINEIKVPQLDSLFISYLRSKLVSKLQDLVADFRKQVCNVVEGCENGLSPTEFSQMFDSESRSILLQFDALDVGAPELTSHYRANLEQTIADSRLQLLETNSVKFDSSFTRIILKAGVEVDKAMELVITGRQQLISVDYNSYIRRSIKTLSRSGKGSRDLDEAEFIAKNYNKVVNELKENITLHEANYKLAVHEFDKEIQAFTRLRTLKSLLDHARKEFTNFDFATYYYNATFVRHGNIKIFGDYISALYGSCTVFNVGRYASETNVALQNLREIEGRYREAVALGTLD